VGVGGLPNPFNPSNPFNPLPHLKSIVMLRKINYYIQWFFIILLIFNTVTGFILNLQWNERYEPVYFSIGLLMSINHILSSIIHFLRHGRESKLAPHLLGSILLIGCWIIVGNLDGHFEVDWDNGFLTQFFIVVPPVGLILYYWHVSFTVLHPDYHKEHSYLDL
jgi:hypothetical protein